MLKTSNLRLEGLIIALCLLAGCDQVQVNGAPQTAVRLDGETAAIVNSTPIYRADVELEAVAAGLIAPGEAFMTDHEQYQLVLDQLIDQRLLAEEAVARNLDLDAASRHRLAIARERVLGNLLVESLVAGEVTEQAIKDMYAEQVRLQQLDDEVRVSLVTVPDEAVIASFIDEFNAGTAFSALAFKYSTDASTRIEGGDLGYIGPAQQDEPFASTIANTPVGEISTPFESEAGWHILKVEDRRQSPPKTLEQMRPDIVTFLTYAQINKTLRQLRNTATIQTSDPSEPASTPEQARPGPTEPTLEPVDDTETDAPSEPTEAPSSTEEPQ